MLWQYAWKNFWRRRTRAALAIAGVVFSIGLLVGVLSISHAVQKAVGDALNAAGADMVIQKRVKPCPFAEVKLPKDLEAFREDVLGKIAQHGAVEEVSGVLDLWAFYKGHPTVVAGVDPAKKTLGPVRIAPKEGEDPEKAKCCAVTEGRYLATTDDYHVLVTVEYAKAKGIKLGDRIHIGPHWVFEVVGIVDLSGAARISGAEAFVPLSTAQEMLGQGKVVSTVFVALKDAAKADEVAELARTIIGPEASVTTSQNVEAGTAALAAVTRKSLLGISALVLVFVLLLLTRHALESVAERVHEVGLMKAIGWRDGEVGRLFMYEAAFSGFLGGVIGCLVGWLIGVVYGAVSTLQLPSALASYPACSSTPPPLSLPLSTAPAPWVFVVGLVAALFIGTLAGAAAARRAAKLPPAVALRRI
ncbi:MAG: ABC transporter permease [Armatimonadetes bacterium]|nr:ABC transporter permease [Armatimonadota bacterium]